MWGEKKLFLKKSPCLFSSLTFLVKLITGNCLSWIQRQCPSLTSSHPPVPEDLCTCTWQSFRSFSTDYRVAAAELISAVRQLSTLIAQTSSFWQTSKLYLQSLKPATPPTSTFCQPDVWGAQESKWQRFLSLSPWLCPLHSLNLLPDFSSVLSVSNHPLNTHLEKKNTYLTTSQYGTISHLIPHFLSSPFRPAALKRLPIYFRPFLSPLPSLF